MAVGRDAFSTLSAADTQIQRIDRALIKHSAHAHFGTTPRLPPITTSNAIACYSGLTSPRPKVKQIFSRTPRFEMSKHEDRRAIGVDTSAIIKRNAGPTFGQSPRNCAIPAVVATSRLGLMPFVPSRSEPSSRATTPPPTRKTRRSMSQPTTRMPTPPDGPKPITSSRRPSRATAAEPTTTTPAVQPNTSASPHGWDLVRQIMRGDKEGLERLNIPHQKALDSLARTARRIRISKEEMFSDEPCDSENLRALVLAEFSGMSYRQGL